MKTKITDLTEVKFRTVYRKDTLGNRIKTKEKFLKRREVRTIKSGPRFGHFIIDFIFFQLLIMIFQFIFSLIGLSFGLSNPLGLSAAFISSVGSLLLYPFIYFICEYNWQQSPGKLLTNSYVINEYAEKPDKRQVALRSLLRLVPFEMFSCLGDVYSYGWHDKWSDTFVVKKEELETLRSLLEEQNRASSN